MRAAVISIGSELVRGRTVDTNSAWLSGELFQLGIPVSYHLTAGDDLDGIVRVLEAAADWADLVISTGGLGPTQDDLTRDALAKVAGTPLVLHEESLRRIQERFERMGRSMPARNRVQALVPDGAEVIPNDHGTAPGIWLELDRPGGRRALIALPGVPTEMKRMFCEQVRPMLKRRFDLRRVFVERKLQVFGAGESHVEELLLDLTRRGRDPEVGITVHEATISIRVVTSGHDEQEALNRMEPTVRTIYERLGELIYGEGDEELEDAVARELRRLRLTVAVAEGCTGGVLQRRLTRPPGATRWFRGGLSAYTNDVKKELLRIDGGLMEAKGAASEEVACRMAEAARILFKADLGVATVGFAGPQPAEAAGLIWTAVASDERVTCEAYQSLGDRESIQERGAKAALNHLRRRLKRSL